MDSIFSTSQYDLFSFTSYQKKKLHCIAAKLGGKEPVKNHNQKAI